MKIEIKESLIQSELAHQLDQLLYQEFLPFIRKAAGVPGQGRLVNELLGDAEWRPALDAEIKKRVQNMISTVVFDSIEARLNPEPWDVPYRAPARILELVEACEKACGELDAEDQELDRMAEILRCAGYTITAPE